jgi:choline-sulfatase
MRRASTVLALVILTSIPAFAQMPDVLLITLDSFRADRLAAFGGDPSLCPNLNGLASRGATFTRCVTPVPVTLPAHATILTGCGPQRTGLLDNGTGGLSREIPTLAEAFKAGGYTTAAVVASSFLDDRFGLARGFDRYDDGARGRVRRSGREVTDAALDLRKDRKGPQFLWVHYFDTHEPYPAPEEAQTKRPGTPYDAAAAYVDSEVGRLLKSFGPGTIVAVAADHGESLGEHGEVGHGVFLFQTTVSVPLLLSGPGVPVGKTFDLPSSLADLAPTLSDLAGLSPRGALDGISLKPALAGKDLPVRPTVLESWAGTLRFRWCPLAGVTDGRWKWLRGRTLRLYDLLADPGESRDLSAAPPEAALALKGSLPDLPKSMADGTIIKDFPDPHERVGLLKTMIQGRALRTQEEYGRAATLFREVTSSDPGNPTAWFELGEASRRKGDLAEAAKALDRALAISPSMPEVLTSRGLLYLSLEKPDSAAEMFERALKVDPTLTAALNPLAAYYLSKSDTAKAFPLLDRAVQEGFANADTYLLEMRIHIVQGKLDAAERDFKSAMATTANPPQTLKGAADIFMIKEMFRQGASLYEEGIRRFPDYAPNYLTLGGYYIQTEQPEKALPLYRRALQCKLGEEERKNVLELVGEIEEILQNPAH